MQYIETKNIDFVQLPTCDKLILRLVKNINIESKYVSAIWRKQL